MKYFEKNPILMIIIGIMGISLSAIFVRYSTAPASVTAAWRLLWTMLLMTPAVFAGKSVRRELFSVSPRLALLCCLSGLFLAVHFVLWFDSLGNTSVASATTIVCTEVIWVALGFFLLLKGRLTVKAVAAIAVAFIGSICIAFSDSGSGTQLYGDILALLAAIASAGYTLIGQVVRKRLSNTVYTYIVYGSCSLVLVATCLVQGAGLFAYGWSAVLVGLGLAVFSTILGHSIFNWCLKYFSPAFVSASKLCEPVVAAIFAIFLFGEVPGWLQILGGVLILGSVFYYSRIESRQKG